MHTNLHIETRGTGPVMLFSHGTPTFSYEWRHLVAGLAADFTCVTVDHLGFGDSPRPEGADYSPEAHARRWREVAQRYERYSLVVHDFGGPIALDAALDHVERLDRLIIFNSFAWPFEGLAPKLAGTALFRWLYRRFNFSFVIARSAWGDARTRTPELWRTYTQRFPDADSRERVLWALAKSLHASSAFFASLERRLDRLSRTPVHLVWGLADTAFPPKELARWRAHLPHAAVTELKRAGHWPHEEQPAECLRAIAG